MKIEELQLAGCWAAVMTPLAHHRVGRDRLASLRDLERDESVIDDALIHAIRTAENSPELLVFRGESGDGAGSWGFADELTDAEADELGYLLIRSQLPLYRELAQLGVTLFLKVQWGPRALSALEGGAQRVVMELQEELERRSVSDERRAIVDLDIWMLRRLSYWMLMSFDECVASFLPRTLTRIQGRRRHVERLVAKMKP